MHQLMEAPFPANERVTQTRLRQLFDSMPVRDLSDGAAPGLSNPLVGGVVTRAGPLDGAFPTAVDQETLSRMALRPVFVGIERGMVAAAIDGDAAEARKRLSSGEEADEALPRRDRSGTWIVPLDGATPHAP
jgi:hypothetical protein